MSSLRQGLFMIGWIIAVLSSAGVVVARDAVITKKDGKQFTGELVSETADLVTLKISGVLMKVDRSQIEEIEYIKTILEQHASRRAELDEQDADAWYRLTYWLYENGEYALAKGELTKMGERHPDDARVSRLSSVLDAKAKAAKTPIQKHRHKTTASVPETDVKKPVGSNDAPLVSQLTDQQINAIKVWEIDLETSPPVMIPRQVIDEFFNIYRGQGSIPLDRAGERAFKALPGYEQLGKMFSVKARGFYDQVQVRTDPPAMKTFRTSIHQRYVLNYCGTNRCHGGDDVGGLTFVNSAPLSETTTYTNFFILHQYETQRYYMIDRVEPDQSLLLQYGLDMDHARARHPEVAGWQPRFQSRDNQGYELIRDWIASLHRPRPDYGISYKNVSSKAGETQAGNQDQAGE